MENIKCPKDLNRFLIDAPYFENTFSEDKCKTAEFYGDCYHCFTTAIAKRDIAKKNVNTEKHGKECHSEYCCKELPYSKECETCAAYYNEEGEIEE